MLQDTHIFYTHTAADYRVLANCYSLTNCRAIRDIGILAYSSTGVNDRMSPDHNTIAYYALQRTILIPWQGRIRGGIALLADDCVILNTDVHTDGDIFVDHDKISDPNGRMDFDSVRYNTV